ncbi:MAG: hypothetical protein HY781_05380 [Chloroflexi bacterium]|nr:hypothetical protein [Chloroflexota bacterium]
MTFFPRLMVGMYGGLLHLYPRKFQAEFREEMQGVFVSAVKGAAGIGTLAFLQLLFFEMLDFPINLAIEHFSQWRRRWSMKDTRFDIRPFRSAAMGALGLLIGFLIAYFGRWYLVLPDWWDKVHIGIPLVKLYMVIPSALNNGLAFALLGLMLCLSVSASSRITLRACFLLAGLGVVANLIGNVIAPPIFNYIYEWNWQDVDVVLVLGTAAIAMSDGLFTGAGLGLAAGGWKSCWRFALKGMLAYGLGFAIGPIIYQLWISSGGSRWTTTETAMVITACIGAVLAGGILGWLWGKANPVGIPKAQTE